MATKYDLPSNGSLSDIKNYYTSLYDTTNKSTVGNFRYPVAGTTFGGFFYDTSGTAYDNLGLTGLMNLIAFGDSLNPSWPMPKMNDYKISSSDYNTVESDITNLSTQKLSKNADTLESYSEKLLINATANGTVTLDLSVQDVFKLTLSNTTTLAFSNVPTTGKAVSVTVAISQGGTAYSVTYPASVKWSNDVVPDISSINKTHFLTFVTFDGGTRFFGFASGLNFTT